MSHLQTILDAAVAAGRAPGFSVAVMDRKGERQTAAAGRRGGGDAPAVTLDTLFWIASCTKAVTSFAAMQLVERGQIELDAPVGAHLPMLAAPRLLTGFDTSGAPITAPAKGQITLRHLLTHTSGLAYDFASESLTRYLNATGGSLMGVDNPDIPLLFEPGEAWHYGIGIDWAGRLIEAVSGQSLDAYFAEHIFAPLGMDDTTFFLDPEQTSRKAGVCQKLGDGDFIPIDFGTPAERHFMMGGGGLYSTPSDYLKFLNAIARNGAPLLKPDTFALLMSNQTGALNVGDVTSVQPMLSHDFAALPGLRKGWGLAGLLNLDAAPGARSAGSMAWAGLANCYYWADPATGVAGVVCAQILPFGDPGVLETFAEVERATYA